jgi:hypothetical protein
VILPAILVVFGVVALLNPPDDAASDRAMTIGVSVTLAGLILFFGLRAFSSWVEHSARDAVEAARAQISQTAHNTAHNTADHMAAVREGRYFAGVLIDGDEIVVGEQRCPLAGATARVDSGGQVTRRLTATRIVFLNVFALAAPKKKDRRYLYLAIEGPTFAFAVPVHPDKSRAAHAFAARITHAGKRVSASTGVAGASASVHGAAPTSNAAPSGDVDAITEALQRAQHLHAEGAISDTEYADMRREILRRV